MSATLNDTRINRGYLTLQTRMISTELALCNPEVTTSQSIGVTNSKVGAWEKKLDQESVFTIVPGVYPEALRILVNIIGGG